CWTGPEPRPCTSPTTTTRRPTSPTASPSCGRDGSSRSERWRSCAATRSTSGWRTSSARSEGGSGSARDQRRHMGGLDVGSAHNEHDRARRRSRLPAEKGGEALRGTAFDDQAVVIEEESHRLPDLALNDQHELLHQAADQAEREAVVER